MNEFTKEELQIIHLDMTTYVNRTPMLSESPSHKALRDKVEFMIDNYCEHDWRYTQHDQPIDCRKCGMNYI